MAKQKKKRLPPVKPKAAPKVEATAVRPMPKPATDIPWSPPERRQVNQGRATAIYLLLFIATCALLAAWGLTHYR